VGITDCRNHTSSSTHNNKKKVLLFYLIKKWLAMAKQEEKPQALNAARDIGSPKANVLFCQNRERSLTYY
jgi:hypothetical protein